MDKYEQRMKKREALYERQLEEMKLRQQVFDKRSELIEAKRSMRRWNPPTTTKVLMAFIFLNCTVVEVYSMAVMYLLQDLSSLYSLITAVVTESISFAIYACKAYNETKQEELIKLERDRMEQTDSNDILGGEDVG